MNLVRGDTASRLSRGERLWKPLVLAAPRYPQGPQGESCFRRQLYLVRKTVRSLACCLLTHAAVGKLAAATSREGEVIDAGVKWSDEFEQPHEIFGGPPVCPFARAVRLKQTVRFEVRPFALDDPLEPNDDILTLVCAFVEEASAGRLETLFVHSDPGQALSDLVAFDARLNSPMANGELHGFQAFEAHAESQFCVGNLYTQRSPDPSFQVLSRALLKKGSDSLWARLTSLDSRRPRG